MIETPDETGLRISREKTPEILEITEMSPEPDSSIPTSPEPVKVVKVGFCTKKNNTQITNKSHILQKTSVTKKTEVKKSRKVKDPEYSLVLYHMSYFSYF